MPITIKDLLTERKTGSRFAHLAKEGMQMDNKQMNKDSASLVIRRIPTETALRSCCHS